MGALHHDIGKIKNPSYFSENQLSGQNLHDQISSKESVEIIKSHVTNGVKIAKNYGLPERIIDFIRTHVGDKYIIRALIERNWILGGEPSGHIICLDKATTGDALIASIKLLESLRDIDFDISKALEEFTKLPQQLISFEVEDPHKIMMNSEVRTELHKLEKKLGKEGRVLIRPSGTEDLLRVMVEASTKELADDLAKELSEFIRKAA